MYRNNGRIFQLEGNSRGRNRAWNPFLDSTIVQENLPGFEKEMQNFTGRGRLKSSFNLLNFYVSRSSVHGVKYILDPELHIIEKLIWLIFVVASICLTAQVFIIIVKEFQAAPTVVVIDSTNYRVSFLPFPSVTICPRDGVDWKKALALERKISNDSEVIELYKMLVGTLSRMSFGKFERLSFLSQLHHKEILNLNITDIMYKIMPNCEDLFFNCYWRNNEQNCCEIFQTQKTEHGFCYSFNSLNSENFQSNESLLEKSTGYGERSGLRFKIKLGNVVFPPIHYRHLRRNEIRSNETNQGITISINDPIVWPKVAKEIKIGMLANVNVKCTSGYASEDVLNLSPNKIPCRFKDLRRNVRYSQETCISECRREHVMKYCGCNPSFYFASADLPACNVTDFTCLYWNQGKFANYQNPDDENFKEGAEDIMTCDCPPACNYFNYDTKLLTLPGYKDEIFVDIHYEGPTSIRYKLIVIISGLELLVNFGGVFGLFVGGSIISLIEVVYVFVIKASCQFYSYVKSKRKDKKSKAALPLKLYLSDFPQTKPNVYIPNKRF